MNSQVLLTTCIMDLARERKSACNGMQALGHITDSFSTGHQRILAATTVAFALHSARQNRLRSTCPSARSRR